MRIEVLCTGDELLTGLTADTNSPFFMERLFALGEQVARTTVVGDVPEELEEAMRTLFARAEVVLVSGGLGPTADDLTAECAARVAGVPLVEDPEALRAIQARFAARGLAFTPNNARQARVPRGAQVVQNRVGSAPMFILTVGTCTAFFVPGVPREYRALVEEEVLPRLAQRIALQPGRIFRVARLLKTIGIAESHLDARMAPLAVRHPRVTFGYRTHAPENHLKLLAEGPDEASARVALEAALGEVRAELGQAVFGEATDELPSVVNALLRARGETVATAESCTGGLIAQRLTDPAGASQGVRGGAVVYQEDLKTKWARVPASRLATFGAVSAEVASDLARGIREEAGATWGLSATGFAGPTGGTEADPVGTVYLGLAGPGGVEVERHRFFGDRARVRAAAAANAIDLLRRRLA
jgi:nicotinamide-nucleotide amidase